MSLRSVISVLAVSTKRSVQQCAQVRRGGVLPTVTPASARTASKPMVNSPTPVPDRGLELVGSVTQVEEQVPAMPHGWRSNWAPPSGNCGRCPTDADMRRCHRPRRVGKPLSRDLTGYHSARRGAYRVVYRIDGHAHVVHAVRIDHRADVYRP
jgi:hypothetical protein